VSKASARQAAKQAATKAATNAPTGETAIDAGDDSQEENSISKSERKRRMTALQSVGEELVALSTDTLKKLDLPDELRVAVLDAKKIGPSKHGGTRRQMQYIGRLMREIEAAPIVEQLEALRAPGRKATAWHHLAERWRERLLTDASSLAAFATEFPQADREALAREVAATHAERAARQPPKHFRVLYQAIHELIVAEAGKTP